MSDKEKTHWLSSPNKNYLGHWDLPENEDLVLTIKKAGFEEVKNPTNGQKDIKKVIHFVEDYKPMICNQTNSKAIYKSTACRYLEDSKGLQIQLYISQTMNRKEGELVDCIRVRATPYKATNKKESKPKLSNMRFNEALKQVKAGNYSINDLKSKFDLSKEQLKQLDNE